MAKPKKDGQFINFYLDRSLCNRLTYYAEERGQTKTVAVERILKQVFDREGIPEFPSKPSEEMETE